MWSKRFEVKKVIDGYIIDTYDDDIQPHQSLRIKKTIDEVYFAMLAFFSKEYCDEDNRGFSDEFSSDNKE